MRVLVILGMHRSGTSAVARVCNLLGAEVGEHLMPPSEGNNPTGFWELDEVRIIHDKLLHSLGSSWDASAPLPADWRKSPQISVFRDRLTEVVRREFGDSEFACLKDPRLCRLVPLWKDIFEALEWTPHYLLTLRNPLDVARSLNARDKLHHCQSHLLWLRHVLEAERWTRGQRRAFVSYEHLMADWRAAMTPAWRQLGLGELTVDPSAAREIDAFLQTDLRHHSSSRDDLENDQRLMLIRRVYDDYASTVRDDASRGSAGFLELEKILTEASFLFEPIIADERGQKTALATQLHSANLRLNAATGDVNRLTHELAAANAQVRARVAEVAERDRIINAVLSSTSWRVTAPVRRITTIARASRDRARVKTADYLRRLFNSLPINDHQKVRLKSYISARTGLMQKLMDSNDGEYRDWIARYDTLNEPDRDAIKQHIERLAHVPLISVIMPVFNTPERFLREAIESVTGQLYEHWELCIADDCSTEPHVSKVIREYQQRDHRIKSVFRECNGNISASSNSALELASGEFIALMDHDDVIPAHALYMVAVAINRNPGADVIYSDEDKVDGNGRRYRPYFKSDWNPDLFYAQNMVNHLGVYRTSLVEAVSGFREGFEGSQDYDLMLRILERTSPDRIVHVPHVLYHWRTASSLNSFSRKELPRALSSAQRALQAHFDRIGVEAAVQPAPGASHYQRVKRPVRSPTPLVSIIIPTRDKVDLLRQCVEGLLTRTHYTAFEVIIVDNDSVEPKTLAYLRAIQSDPRVRVLAYDEEFNYSAINNFAIRQAKGELVCLLNNDIVVINEEWLSELVSHAVRPEVGAAGAMLYYPDDTIQHAGIVVGVGGVAGHSHKLFRRGDPGYFGRLSLAHNVSGVTGACLLARRAVLDECGGLDAENLKVAFNDVDLCLKLRERGYLIVWTPHAELYHLESASRGSDNVPETVDRFNREQVWMKQRWGESLANDPYYNPNLTLEKSDFSLAFPPRVGKPWRDMSAFSEDNAGTRAQAATQGPGNKYVEHELRDEF
ncbi:MAG: glycosyltransferase [Gammaproteobacteria bacterium]